MRLRPRKQVYLDDLPKTHDFRFSVLLVVLFVTVVGAVYAVGYFVAGDRLATGTTVAGVDVGGMDRDEARTVLQEEFAPRMEQPITLTAAGRKFKVDPQEAGLALDLDASVEQGLGASAWDPSHMLEVVTGGESHDAIVEVDRAEFQTTVDEVAAEVEREPVDASVTFARVPTFDAAVEGVRIDREALLSALTDAVLDGDDSVDLPLTAVEPAVTTTQASDFVDDVAVPAVAEPVRIRVADSVLRVPPSVLTRGLRAVEEDGALELTADVDALYAASGDLIDSLPHRAVDAAVVMRDGRPVVVPGRSGATVSADDWAVAVVAAAQERGDDRRAAATITEALPAFGTADARQLRISERLAVVDVAVPGRLDEAGVEQAAGRIDAVVIRPGRTFGLQARVAGVPDNEASVVATGLFDVSFRAGLGIDERHEPGSHTIGEAGLDAALGQGKDLVVRNTTPYGVLATAALVDGPGRSSSLRIELWGAGYWAVSVTPGARYDVQPPGIDRQSGAGCRPDPGAAGFAIEVSRTLSAEGVGESTEIVHSRYRPADRVVCRR